MKFDAFTLVRILPVGRGTRLRLQGELLNRAYERDKRKALANRESQQDVWMSWSFEFQMHEDAETRFHSQRLIRQANRLRVPTPSLYQGATMVLSDDYTQSGLDGSYYLSTIGETRLRAAIREEEKYRSEKWTRRIPYITALTGLIGALTGLIAIWHKSGR